MCTCPLDAWPAGPHRPDRRPVFSPRESYTGARPFPLRCGQCMQCRIRRVREFAVRGFHEASLHEANSFLTFTYDEAHLPPGGSLLKSEAQKLKKRMRYVEGPFRSILSGEYGDKRLRPHFHMIRFGEDYMADREPVRRSEKGELLFRSATVQKSWPYGEVLIGACNLKSIEYTCRYAVKKITGELAQERYLRREVDPATGELREWYVEPEFCLFPLKPGLGRPWLDAYEGDTFKGFITVDGVKRPVPQYYIDHWEESRALRLKLARKADARAHADNNTDARLLVRHELGELRARDLRRALDASL